MTTTVPHYGNHPRPCTLFLTVMLFLAAAVGATTASASGDPRPNPSAVVRAGNARFTFLTDRLVRMEWSEDGRFEDRASLLFIDRNLPAPALSTGSSGDTLTVSTASLTLRYRKNSGKFSAENLTVSMTLNGRTVEWRPGMTDSANLKGTTRTLDGTNGAGDVTLGDGILSRGGWSVVDDSHRPLFDESEENWVASRPAGGRQDLYFFGYGHDYRGALYDFTRVAGKIPMPPRFAFGYWWSRYWTYSDAELRGLVGEMDRYGVPIDVLIIDMDWHETYGLSSRNLRRDPAGEMVGWTGYTWNRRLFPDPGAFLRWTGERGLKTALNLHPASGIAPMEERYAEFAAAYGADTTGRPYIPFAIEDRNWTRAYFDVMLRPLEEQGVDFWWLDWQAWLDNRNIPDLSNTWWLNHVFFTEMERRGGKRPLLFHRWGGLGNHRYQIGFSGDSWSTWEALAYQPYFTATAGNVGYGYWSHDIGGHVGNDPDPELYLRWLQWGIFSPIVRTHSTKSATIERRIWKYTEYFETMRDALVLRYRMNPYIYTAARRAYDTGVSVCRPMYYEHPEKEEAYGFTGQYMFGDDILVAPVTSKASEESGLAEKEIWLPPGEWYEWSSGTLTSGGRRIQQTYTPEEIPVFVRANAIIPMFPPISRLDRMPDTLVLTVFPGSPDSGGGSLYEDDGTTIAYQDDGYAFTEFVKERTGGTLPGTRVTVRPRTGRYAGMPASRAYEVRFPSTLPPETVTVNGEPYPYSASPLPRSWTYDGPLLSTVVRTPQSRCDSPLVVEVRWRGDGPRAGRLLDGRIGLLGRLPKIITMIKNEVNLRDQIANAPTSLLDVGSLGSRISYRPELCRAYLAEFDSQFRDLVNDIAWYPGGDRRVLERAVSLLSANELVTQAPAIRIDTASSVSPVTVSITPARPGARIFYTLDGSEPVETPGTGGASQPYTAPFRLGKTARVTARAFEPGLIGSFTSTAAFHLDIASMVAYEHPVNPKYDGGGAKALVDGVFGSAEDFRNGWVGIQGDDIVATVKLSGTGRRSVSSVALRCLQNQGSWIFYPEKVVFEVSADGVAYTALEEVGRAESALRQESRPGTRIFRTSAGADDVSYIRIRARNVGTLPPWHRSAGERAWLFADEIIIETDD